MLLYENILAQRDDRNRLLALVDDLQAGGRYTVTGTELARRLGRSAVAVRAALRRLKAKGRIASPRRGFYVLVPIEYRAAGCPPADWFIDDLARFLRQPYYVGLLSAAALHGAAHQQPTTFQVVTNKPTRPVQVGRVRIEFHVSRRAARTPAEEKQTQTGTMRVATPEATALDLVRFAGAAGGVSNIATVLDELAATMDSGRLAAAARRYGVPDIQRLGYLLDHLGKVRLSAGLAAVLKKQRFRPVRLAPAEPTRKRAADQSWRVIPNEMIEVDH